MKSFVFLYLFSYSFALGAILDVNHFPGKSLPPGCYANDCIRAVVGKKNNPHHLLTGASHCHKFMTTSVFIDPAYTTTTATIKYTTTEIPPCSRISRDSSFVTNKPTPIGKLEPDGQYKPDGQYEPAYVTIKGAVPDYAKGACLEDQDIGIDDEQYSRACACLGIMPAVTSITSATLVRRETTTSTCRRTGTCTTGKPTTCTNTSAKITTSYNSTTWTTIISIISSIDTWTDLNNPRSGRVSRSPRPTMSITTGPSYSNTTISPSSNTTTLCSTAKTFLANTTSYSTTKLPFNNTILNSIPSSTDTWDDLEHLRSGRFSRSPRPTMPTTTGPSSSNATIPSYSNTTTPYSTTKHFIANTTSCSTTQSLFTNTTTVNSIPSPTDTWDDLEHLRSGRFSRSPRPTMSTTTGPSYSNTSTSLYSNATILPYSNTTILYNTAKPFSPSTTSCSTTKLPFNNTAIVNSIPSSIDTWTDIEHLRSGRFSRSPRPTMPTMTGPLSSNATISSHFNTTALSHPNTTSCSTIQSLLTNTTIDSIPSSTDTWTDLEHLRSGRFSRSPRPTMPTMTGPLSSNATILSYVNTTTISYPNTTSCSTTQSLPTNTTIDSIPSSTDTWTDLEHLRSGRFSRSPRPTMPTMTGPSSSNGTILPYSNTTTPCSTSTLSHLNTTSCSTTKSPFANTTIVDSIPSSIDTWADSDNPRSGRVSRSPRPIMPTTTGSSSSNATIPPYSNMTTPCSTTKSFLTNTTSCTKTQSPLTYTTKVNSSPSSTDTWTDLDNPRSGRVSRSPRPIVSTTTGLPYSDTTTPCSTTKSFLANTTRCSKTQSPLTYLTIANLSPSSTDTWIDLDNPRSGRVSRSPGPIMSTTTGLPYSNTTTPCSTTQSTPTDTTTSSGSSFSSDSTTQFNDSSFS